LRDRILDIAHARLRRTGDFSMREIGAEAGVTAAALYHHFGGKRELLECVAERAFVEFGSRLRIAAPADPREAIRAILRGYRDFARDEPALFQLLFVNPRPSARKFPRDFAAHRSAVFNTLWRSIEQLGYDSDTALYAAHDLWALAHGQVMLWRAGRFESDEVFEQIFDRSIERGL
jgi:AcrR family transcriptional regulator